MAKATSYGTCCLCDRRISKAGMTRHVKTCAPAHDETEGKVRRLLHLRVEGAYAPMYWLDLEIKADVELTVLDNFLRGIWLECCGHLSAFRIGSYRYEVALDDEYAAWDDQRSMDVPLAEVLHQVGEKFSYEYDFGSTTELNLRVAGTRDGAVGRAPLRLLARNEPLVWPCAVCERPATQLCAYCIYDSASFFCDEHALAHDCGEEALLPVVNSPRMGVCAYTG